MIKKVQKHCNSECYTPLSEFFRLYLLQKMSHRRKNSRVKLTSSSFRNKETDGEAWLLCDIYNNVPLYATSCISLFHSSLQLQISFQQFVSKHQFTWYYWAFWISSTIQYFSQHFQTMSKNPVILITTHHHQNPLQSTINLHFSFMG
jgi:hypothetical protein